MGPRKYKPFQKSFQKTAVFEWRGSAEAVEEGVEGLGHKENYYSPQQSLSRDLVHCVVAVLVTGQRGQGQWNPTMGQLKVCALSSLTHSPATASIFYSLSSLHLTVFLLFSSHQLVFNNKQVDSAWRQWSLSLGPVTLCHQFTQDRVYLLLPLCTAALGQTLQNNKNKDKWAQKQSKPPEYNCTQQLCLEH